MDASGATLNDIIAGIKKVTDIVGEIVAASAEQSSGIEQINHAVAQMDSVTQQNAALVEEATAASKSTEDQAAALSRQIAFFKTDDLHEMGSDWKRVAPPAPAHDRPRRTASIEGPPRKANAA